MIRHYKRAIQDIRDNRFLHGITVTTISISILIVSSFSLFFTNAGDTMNTWKKGVRIMAYLKGDIPNIKIPGLKLTIQKIYGVKGIQYISKDEALKRFKNQIKNQASLLEGLKKNPLPDAFEIRMIPSFQSKDKIEALALQIKSLPLIDEVEYGQKWLGRFASIFNLFKLAGYAMGGLFFIAAIFIVANTIRLVLYSRREEVEIMRLVGATDRFIKAPFYIEGLIEGLMGGVIGLGVLFVMFMAISSNMEQDISSGMISIKFLSCKILLGILAGSMVVGWLGSYLSLKQFLK